MSCFTWNSIFSIFDKTSAKIAQCTCNLHVDVATWKFQNYRTCFLLLSFCLFSDALIEQKQFVISVHSCIYHKTAFVFWLNYSQLDLCIAILSHIFIDVIIFIYILIPLWIIIFSDVALILLFAFIGLQLVIRLFS